MECVFFLGKRMNVFLISALLLQVLLLSLSRYFDDASYDTLKNASVSPVSSFIQDIDKYKYYGDVGDCLGYLSASIWLLVMVILNVKKVTESKMTTLVIYFPLLISVFL